MRNLRSMSPEWAKETNMISRWHIAAFFAVAMSVTLAFVSDVSAQPPDPCDAPPDPCALFDPF